MKTYIIILFLITVGVSYGQPVIDSMLIDETKGKLHIFGTFGTTPGKVYIDNLEMTVIHWTNSQIISDIPDTGKGSAGPVVVEAEGALSNITMITEWAGVWSYLHTSQDALRRNYGYGLYFSVRMDIHSLFHHQNNVTRNFIPRKGCHVYAYNDTWFQMNCGVGKSEANAAVSLQDSGALYEKGFHCQGIYESSLRTFLFYAKDIRGIFGKTDSCIQEKQGLVQIDYECPVPDFGVSVSLDSLMQIIQYDHIKKIDDSHGDEYHMSSSGINFLPPPDIFALYNKPVLLSPPKGALFSYKNNIVLSWDTLSHMSGYRIQVSKDSIFSDTLSDIMTDLPISVLPPLEGLTKYFWRIAGVNPEGESRWSTVWNFTTGGITNAVNTQTSNINFSVYPNPASDKLNITFTTTKGDFAIALYDLLGNRVQVLKQQLEGANKAEMSVAGLPTGVYLLDILNESVHRSMPISILR